MTQLARFRPVPPAPEVMAQLYADYRRKYPAKEKSFAYYLREIDLGSEQAALRGRDAGPSARVGATAMVSVPRFRIEGRLKLMVLLVDFTDRPGTRSKQSYEDMLFSNKTYLTGSMRDFYAEASAGKVQVEGDIHGWLRMPQPYSFYVGADSGMGPYPGNAQKLAEDALQVAKDNGVAFSSDLDKLNQQSITALFLVHAGPGAETIANEQLQKRHIWSHKADLNSPFELTPNLFATNYLTVPEDCRMGVCAHELGHLAFQWDDFYDPDYEENGEWDGAGNWDLMAGGTWNDGGNTPAHPAALHKSQHGWVTSVVKTSSATNVVLKPITSANPKILVVRAPSFTPTQALVLENRSRKGFDRALPGEGLLVWRVDTDLEQVAAGNPAMTLIQADGLHDLETPNDGNEGDAGDPFPGSKGKTSLSDLGAVSTSFPGSRSGVTLKNIRRNPATGAVSFDLKIS